MPRFAPACCTAVKARVFLHLARGLLRPALTTYTPPVSRCGIPNRRYTAKVTKSNHGERSKDRGEGYHTSAVVRFKLNSFRCARTPLPSKQSRVVYTGDVIPVDDRSIDPDWLTHLNSPLPNPLLRLACPYTKRSLKSTK